VLVAYEADIRPVFDTREAEALSAFGLTPTTSPPALGATKMIARGESGAQKFARPLVAEGYAALLVRTFARGASHKALNLVLWRWSRAPPAKLVLVER
jgi:hypothetical protein